ncbi:MAG TPA: SDR family oxidoreductase, partial [Candidatus Binataceae bacterium]|nr:SDR family oxidoreductase [Candidatus Binataceae bacterium]
MGIADGKRALVVGVANDRSIAWSITQELAKQGAQIAMTYQGEALKKRVEPLAEQVGANIIGELDVTVDEQIESTLRKVKALWGG